MKLWWNEIGQGEEMKLGKVRSKARQNSKQKRGIDSPSICLVNFDTIRKPYKQTSVDIDFRKDRSVAGLIT